MNENSLFREAVEEALAFMQIEELKQRLKPGEYVTYFGKCYICGQIESTEGEGHSYFVKDKNMNKQFVSKRCYSGDIGKGMERVPVFNSKKLIHWNLFL